MSQMPRVILKIVILILVLPVSRAGAQEASPNVVYDSEPQVEVPNSRYFSVAFIEKAKRLVFINSGEAHGINKGDRVCILDQTRVKIGCFRIRIINKTSAAFKPSKKKMAKINSGMVARFAEDEEQLDEDFEDNKTSYIEMGFVFSPLLPHTFNQVLYQEDVESPGALRFVKGDAVKSNFTQAYLGSQIQFSASFGLSSGLLTRSFAPLTAESDLGASYLDSAAVHKYSVVGFGMPFLLRWVYGTGNTQLVLLEGLQWDMSYLRYRLYTRNAAEEETLILKHVSLLNTVSLKAEIGASFKVGQFSRINTTVGLVVPITEFGGVMSTEYADSSQSVSDSQKKDMVEAIGHKKSNVGLDVLLSFGLGF
jgi:hypothetical protein